ncbi:MAG TPA: mechanosensitive ion channel family protein [Deltaproteobacteria bacterium]|mgnify:CR=1 FL=1|jgi:MscS family membrane protein|nr:mechanosensitive ion channel family protein [Deltaproteobacteria bacterium]HOI06137.1 mechanosensitive ion channel family protein [Deltaproteobacteria bacterium]
MHPWKGSVRGGLVFAFVLVWLLGFGPGSLAAGPGDKGLTAGVVSAEGTGSGDTYSESAAVKSATDAGMRISEDIDSLGREIPGFFGSWAGKGAFKSITYLDLLASLVLLFLVFLVNRIIRSYIDGRVRDLLARNGRFAEIRSFWDALSRPLSLFILVYGTFLALSPILLELKKVESLSMAYLVASKAADFAGYIAIFWFIYRLANVLESFLRKKAFATESHLEDTLVPLLGRTARIFVVIIGAAIVVKSLTGLDFGPLLASLGIGGMAVAFAAKDSIGNFLGSLTILFDKPFTVGDRIVLEGRDGVVEELGFRSTRIRTATGSLVSIPNEKIINTLVENIGRKPYVRWTANLFIAPSTPPEKVERAVEIVREILRDHEGMARECPPKVHLSGFGERWLTITITAWYHRGGAGTYEEWLQKTCLKVLTSFRDEGIRLIGGK